MKQLIYRPAQPKDIDRLVILINESYRIKTGSSWSSEQNIVSGERINHQQLRLSLESQNFSLFMTEIVEKTHAE